VGPSARDYLSRAIPHVGLDKVQVVTGHTGGPPDPATWAMMLLGFGGIGLATCAAWQRMHGAPASLAAPAMASARIGRELTVSFGEFLSESSRQCGQYWEEPET
jgi:hypothetical protein